MRDREIIMHQVVNRPAPPEKKIKTSDNFELAYLRHQYFRRVKYNPTEAEMQPYMKIVERLTKNTFSVYFNLFRAVGMYQEDVLNIGRVHLVSFLGLYALESQDDKKKKEYVDRIERYEYRTPDESDFEQKNKANFTMFFKQRMEDLVRVCRQKVRNIKGQSTEEYHVFSGPVCPRNPRRLLKNYEELGFKKIDFSIFKSIRKKADVEYDALVFEFGGVWYVAIAIQQKNLEIEDLIGSESNPYENSHNMRPDDLYAENEQERLQKGFSKKSNYRKRATLRNFIAKNRNRVQYKEEIATAKKLLRGLGD